MNARRLEIALVAAALATYVALSVASLRRESATFDEGAHLPAGYTYWARGDFRLNPEHPPLVKLIAAAPLRLLDVTMRDGDVTWASRRQWEFGRRFLYHWNDADRLLLYGRLPIVAMGALLGLAVYAFARRRLGRGVAGAALFFCLLSPDVLAHGHLVTTDVAIALLTFLAVYALHRLGEDVTPRRAAAFVAACAAALAAKFSALLFVPIVGVLGAMVLRTHPRGRAWRVAAAFVAAIALASVLALWATYGFRFAASPDPSQAFDWSRVQPENRLVSATVLTARDHHLLPEALLYGFLRFFKAQESRPAYLHGAVSDAGWWYYFPATFAVKTPLPLILLIAMAAIHTLQRRGQGDLRLEVFLWAPPVLYMLLVMTRSLNIGHRHLLPIYPYLFVLAARRAVDLLRHRAPAARVGAAALLLWYAGGTLRLHPHYLAYFNELAGGPANGHRWLVDSNLDWGQDLKGLKEWMAERNVSEITLSYFGTADPDYYGIHGSRLPGLLRPPRLAAGFRAGDWVAVSATNLEAVYLRGEAQRLMEQLRGETPVDTIGHSIFIYRPRFDYTWPEGVDSGSNEGPVY
jgi:4-amino-4-deoxy-L-arabinose transferase-like glycosyltransferase